MNAMLRFALALALVAALGFARGMRPGRPKLPTLSSIFLLSFFSGLVILSAWVLVSETSPARLMSWGLDNYDLLLIYPALGLFCVGVSFALAFSWSFVVGRSITAQRLRRRPEARVKPTACRPTPPVP
jgi:hypothetical protein